jgi:branched-chain amino acid transport system substrate-binding protein
MSFSGKFRACVTQACLLRVFILSQKLEFHSMNHKFNVVIAAAALAAATQVSAQDVVKIGHVGPTSGGIAHLGKDNENGARMAIDELNAKGVSIGGKKVKFELLAEDDGGDPKQGTAAAQKLVDSKVAGVVGHLNSGTSIPASKIYSDAGIPQISPSATNPKYTRQGFKTTFRVVADDVHLGGTLGKYAAKQLKGKSIAVIDDRTAYGQGVADEFEKGVKAGGGKTVAREFTNDKATDFTAILTNLKAKKPDIIFFGGMDAVAGPMIRQMKQLGIKAKFMGGDGICSGELPKLAGGAMEDGQVVCAEAGGVEGEQKKSMEDFKARFKTKFNADVQIYAPYVYDSLNVMVAAMEKAGSSDPAKYLPVLAKTAGYKGVTGTISFDEKGDVKNGALTMFTYKGGAREQIAVVR